VVVWLCTQVEGQNPRLLGQNPTPLRQHVLLSLIQQLGFDLSKDTLQKLTWLIDAVLVLNPKDPDVARHVPVVLAQLLHNLEDLYPSFSVSTNPGSTSFKLLLRLVNYLFNLAKT